MHQPLFLHKKDIMKYCIYLKSALSLILISVCFILDAYTQENQTTFPKITGYLGILHPIATLNNDGLHTNFTDYYVVGMPTGINIWKTEKIGFSFEIVPFIRTENGLSRANNILIHPGILLKLKHGFTLVNRIAFETSGRYGFTPILNKVIKKNKHSNYFIAMPLPVRFGNNNPASATVAFQFGIGF